MIQNGILLCRLSKTSFVNPAVVFFAHWKSTNVLFARVGLSFNKNTSFKLHMHKNTQKSVNDRNICTLKQKLKKKKKWAAYLHEKRYRHKDTNQYNQTLSNIHHCVAQK